MTRILRVLSMTTIRSQEQSDGLYADENIKKDDGTLVWKKDELIDQKDNDKREGDPFYKKGYGWKRNN